MNTKEILFDGEVIVDLFSAKVCKVDGSIKRIRNIQIPTMLLLLTGAGLNIVSKLVVPPSCRCHIQHFSIPLWRTADNETLEVEGFKQSHVQIEHLEVSVLFGVVKELFHNLRVTDFFMDCYVRDIFYSEQNILLKSSKLVYMSAMGHESKN